MTRTARSVLGFGAHNWSIHHSVISVIHYRVKSLAPSDLHVLLIVWYLSFLAMVETVLIWYIWMKIISIGIGANGQLNSSLYFLVIRGMTLCI